jgi:separase
MRKMLTAIRRAHLSSVDGLRSATSESRAHSVPRPPMLCYVNSLVALQLGDVAQALISIKAGLRTLTHDWQKLEGAIKSGIESNDTSLANQSIDTVAPSDTKSSSMGPKFWALAPSFLRCLLHISAVYAHVGMYQETVYYAEYAGRIAESTQSNMYRAQVAAWLGAVFTKAGKLDKATCMLAQAKQYLPTDTCAARVRLAQELAGFYRSLGDEDESNVFFQIAEDTARQLQNLQLSKAAVEQAGEERTQQKAQPTRTVRATRATAKTTATRSIAKRAPRIKTNAVPTLSATLVPSMSKDLYSSSLVASVALSRALSCIQQRDWTAALETLGTVRDIPKLTGTMSHRPEHGTDDCRPCILRDARFDNIIPCHHGGFRQGLSQQNLSITIATAEGPGCCIGWEEFQGRP